MSELERDIEMLHRYHDGELSGFQHWRFERRLRRSPGLQRELDALEGLRSSFLDLGPEALESAPSTEDLWSGIASALPAIDAQVASEAASGVRRNEAEFGLSEPKEPVLGLPGWAFGTAALAGAAALAWAVVISPATPVPVEALPPMTADASAVRFVDGGGESVMLIEDQDEAVTIVWMMDSV